MDRAWEALKEELGMKDKRTVEDELKQEKCENEKLREQLRKYRGAKRATKRLFWR